MVAGTIITPGEIAVFDDFFFIIDVNVSAIDYRSDVFVPRVIYYAPGPRECFAGCHHNAIQLFLYRYLGATELARLPPRQ